MKNIESEEYEEMFHLYCPRVDKVLHCAEEFKPLAGYCLDADEMEAITIVFNLIKRFTTFICHNDGEHVISKNFSRQKKKIFFN